MSAVEIQPDAELLLRQRLGVTPLEKLRISYVSGTGDVVGTFRHWHQKRPDPRVPVVTYSSMFYDLACAIDADVQLVTPWESELDLHDRIHFTTVPRHRAGSKIGHILAEIGFTRRCMKAVERFNPHVVIVTTDFQPFGWTRLSRTRKLILSAHNTFWPMGRQSGGLKHKAKMLIIRSQVRALNAAVCTSNECMRQIRELRGGDMPLFVEFPQIVALYDARETDIARNLLFLGRIEENKGVFMLLEAFLKLVPSRPDLRLIFAGGGAAAEELMRRIRAAGNPRVVYVGMLDAEDVHREIGRSDLIVCPTTSAFNEGLALVGFEAAAHGVPSLVSSVVPAAESLREGCAIFEADNADALLSALTQLTNDAVAYTKLKAGIMSVRPALYERPRSWGSQLLKALLSV